MIDTFSVVLFTIVAILIFGTLGLFLYDNSVNGINDCIDAPEYCKTYGDLVTEYPQFITPENLIHQYVDESLEHH